MTRRRPTANTSRMNLRHIPLIKDSRFSQNTGSQALSHQCNHQIQATFFFLLLTLQNSRDQSDGFLLGLRPLPPCGIIRLPNRGRGEGLFSCPSGHRLG